jgi:hypothetical protein
VISNLCSINSMLEIWTFFHTNIVGKVSLLYHFLLIMDGIYTMGSTYYTLIDRVSVQNCIPSLRSGVSSMHCKNKSGFESDNTSLNIGIENSIISLIPYAPASSNHNFHDNVQ